jgi:hypothetical protein
MEFEPLLDWFETLLKKTSQYVRFFQNLDDCNRCNSHYVIAVIAIM